MELKHHTIAGLQEYFLLFYNIYDAFDPKVKSLSQDSSSSAIHSHHERPPRRVRQIPSTKQTTQTNCQQLRSLEREFLLRVQAYSLKLNEKATFIRRLTSASTNIKPPALELAYLRA